MAVQDRTPITLRLDYSLLIDLTWLAESRNVSREALIRQALAEFVLNESDATDPDGALDRAAAEIAKAKRMMAAQRCCRAEERIAAEKPVWAED